MDTSKDFRIRLAEKGVQELEKSLNNLRVQGRKELIRNVKEMASDLQIIKYSYIPFEELSEFETTVKISKKSEEMLEIVKKAEKDFHQLNSKYWLEYLKDLHELFRRGEISRAYEAIRYFSGEIISNSKISSNLWLCNVDCGFKLEIVTNSQTFRQGRYAVVSYLPPRQFGNVVSEGMFVDVELNKKGELSYQEIQAIKDSLGEVEAVILNII